ncbi:MAG: hypothetical protein GXP31_12960 [Kiritimatiellaeota bacterium]|nr:hypothetical protein [Kiritimatiellota bacterium]
MWSSSVVRQRVGVRSGAKAPAGRVRSGCRRTFLTAVVFLMGLWPGVKADTAHGPAKLDKKLIEYGWDVPFADFVRDHIREMEKRPFDGLIFKLRGGGKVLVPTPWPEKQFAADFEALKGIQWNKFTDNFIIMWAASDQDWFDDAHWAAICGNAKLLARAARVGRCVGLCFDQEPYGSNPWAYSRAAHRDAKSFAEYEAQVRRRGAEFARAVESEFPDAVILTFFQLSYFGSLYKPMPPAERARRLSKMHYALLPAFLRGMLDAAGPGLRIVDGNESAYYYTDRNAYFEVYHRIRQGARYLLDPELEARYRDHVEAGQALYIDQYFALRTRRVLSRWMPAEDRARWFEHNVYWALQTADRYVWCYSERMNWWQDRNIPPGCEEAIRSARAKIDRGESLGFDLAPAIAAAKAKERAEIAARLKPRTLEVRRLPVGVEPPVIDGRIDDPAWTAAAKPVEFVPLATQPRKLVGKTRAWVLWDDRALYIAVRCQEPRLAGMKIVGRERDDPVWEGDDVEVQICPPGAKTAPFYHFMLNPNGVAWDAVNGDEVVLGYDPDWRHAVSRGRGFWAAEMAIPWGALKMAPPQPGLKLRANLCRQRIQGRELSAWSPMAKGFLEHDLFGTWVFR